MTRALSGSTRFSTFLLRSALPLATLTALAVPACDDGTVGPNPEPEPDPPSAPQAPVVEALGVTEIRVAWMDLGGDETEYRVERRPAAAAVNSRATVATTSGDSVAIIDVGLNGGTAYCYAIVALRGAAPSEPSDESCVATHPVVVAPTTPRVTALGQTELLLEWQDAATDEDGFEVQRRLQSQGEAGFTAVGDSPANATAFVDTGLAVWTTYCYRVRARRGGSVSAWSDTRCGVTDPPSIGTWTTGAPMPTPRQEMGAAAIDGAIYVPGGLNSAGTALDVLEIYDPATDSWTTGAPMPGARHHQGVVAYQGLLYVFGGFLPGAYPWHASADVFAYDPSTDTWTGRRSMPKPLAGLGAALIGDRIYVVGGAHHETNATAHLFEYDPATDTWTERASMPTRREHLAAVAIDGRLYVVGGRVTDDPARFGATTRNLATLEVYDPTTNAWAVHPNMPTARGGLFAGVADGRLYAMGGEFPSVFPHVEEYDPIEGTWRQVTPLPTRRHAAATATVGRTIYTFGGGLSFGFSESATNEAFTPPDP